MKTVRLALIAFLAAGSAAAKPPATPLAESTDPIALAAKIRRLEQRVARLERLSAHDLVAPGMLAVGRCPRSERIWVNRLLSRRSARSAVFISSTAQGASMVSHPWRGDVPSVSGANPMVPERSSLTSSARFV